MKDLNNIVNIKTKREAKQTLPWFEKKSGIIGLSLIMSISLLGGAITASTFLIGTINTTAPIIIDNSKPSLTPALIDTFKLLNTVDNKVSRLKVWNQYMNDLTTAKPLSGAARNNELNNIIMSDEFINEFIGFLTNNLNIGPITTGGAISQQNADFIKATLSNNINQPLFKIPTLVKYNNLFAFTAPNVVMFQFLDNEITPTINFSLSLPVANLDLIYNEGDGTVSIETMPNNTQVKLTINKFDALSITTPTDIYFKSENIFKLPSMITNGLINYLDGPTGLIQLEDQHRKTLINNFEAIQTKINNDKTNVTGISYWNAFVLNYATVNTNFIINDLSKSSQTGGIYKFLKANAKNIPQTDLNQLYSILSQSANFKINPQPFIASKAYSDNSLFVTTKQSDPIYSLNLNITKFNYKFSIPNFFTNNKITVSPILTFSGTLKKVSDVNNITNYDIALADYDVSEMIDMSTTTGLHGFIADLSDPKKVDLPINSFTNSLVNLNSQPIASQIKFWNVFNNPDNQLAIANELSKPDVLYNFIMSNIDINNINGYGIFPSVNWDTIKKSINASVAETFKYQLPNLKIVSGNSYNQPGIQFGDIHWGGGVNDKFRSVKIYFGDDIISSISNFDVTSTIDGSLSKVSLSHGVGYTSFSGNDLNEVILSGSQRMSIVFQTQYWQAHVFYFGQKKLVNGEQTTVPIVFPETILSKATNFANTIKTIK